MTLFGKGLLAATTQSRSPEVLTQYTGDRVTGSPDRDDTYGADARARTEAELEGQPPMKDTRAAGPSQELEHTRKGSPLRCRESDHEPPGLGEPTFLGRQQPV